MFNMGTDKIKYIVEILKGNDKYKAYSGKLITLMEYKKSYARLLVQIAASIEYVTPFCKATFNLENDADSLSFVTGSNIRKTDNRISSCDIKIERVKKNAKTTSSVVEPLVATINKKMLDATIFEEDKKIELNDLIESYDKNKTRVDEDR